MPINAGVPELQKAIKDLDAVITKSDESGEKRFKCASVEKERV